MFQVLSIGGSPRRRAWLAAGLCLGLAIPAILLAQQGVESERAVDVNDEDDRVRRIRALFRHAEETDAASRVIAAAFTEQVADQLARLRNAADEREVIERIESLTTGELPAPARERLYLAAVTRLRERGTAAALPTVRALSERSPMVVARVPGCRRDVVVAVFPYQLEAGRAEFAILERSALAELDRLEPEERVDWLVDSARFERSSPRLSAALKAIAGTPRPLRTEVRARLWEMTSGAAPGPAGELLTQTYLSDEIVPAAAELRRLPLAAAQRLVEEATRSASAAYRRAAIDGARADGRVASLALFLDSGTGRLVPREALERDGASAAAILSHDRSRVRTRQLEEILADATAEESLRRHAALALIHQATPESRRAIARCLLSGEVPARLGEKLRRWLDR